jgi:hypothetical protein
MQILYEKRSWADKAHVAFQDIEQFRKFVDTQPTQERAETGQPGLVRNEIPLPVPQVPHRAVFKKRERPTAESGPHLAKKNRGSEPQTYKKSDEKKYRGKYDEAEQGKKQIQYSFPPLPVDTM